MPKKLLSSKTIAKPARPHIGRRIRQDILKEKRAEYGAKIVSALGTQLSREFGRGFNEKNLRRMVQFAEVFPNEPIVAALRRQLGWTHFKSIIYLDDTLKRYTAVQSDFRLYCTKNQARCRRSGYCLVPDRITL